MKIIVTHISPDLDAITSVWLIRKFLPGWNEAGVKFVPAGERISKIKNQKSKIKNPVEIIEEDEIIHVDTGLGPLDHHHIDDEKVSATSLTFDFVKRTINPSTEFTPSGVEGLRASSQPFDLAQGSPREFTPRGKQSTINEDKISALERIVKLVTEIDHFKEVFWQDPTADYHELSLIGILEGLKMQKPDQDEFYVEFISECLDALLHDFEDRIWAEKEIAQSGHEFLTKWGKGIGFETLNDTVLKLAQKMGYVVVARKDPRKGYVRVKARPSTNNQQSTLRLCSGRAINNQQGVDLTLAYEKLKKIDPDATWFLHVSKKMLLNGSAKNPKTRATKLSLGDIIKVLKTV